MRIGFNNITFGFIGLFSKKILNWEFLFGVQEINLFL